MDSNTEWTIDLNVKPIATKLLEENMKRNLSYLGFGNIC